MGKDNGLKNQLTFHTFNAKNKKEWLRRITFIFFCLFYYKKESFINGLFEFQRCLFNYFFNKC